MVFRDAATHFVRAARNREARNRCDRSQSLAAKAERRKIQEVAFRADFARGVRMRRRQKIFL